MTDIVAELNMIAGPRHSDLNDDGHIIAKGVEEIVRLRKALAEVVIRTMPYQDDREITDALRWLAEHELWQDIYPDGPERPSIAAGHIPARHVRAARLALGLTAADLGYLPSPIVKR